MIDRRALLAGGTAATAGVMRTDARTEDRPVRTVSVRDFGARGDGQSDDTDAFNRACRASEPWSDELCYAVRIPSGRYRLKGTVFIRKGQSLLGDGHASYVDARNATGSTFILGRRASGENGGRGTPDPGGAPVRLSGIRSMGGSPTRGFIETDAQGFTISDLFLTAVGVGIEISGPLGGVASDGIVRDVVIDQCLQGLLIGRAQNLNIGSVNIYRPRFAVTIGDGAHDIILSALSVAYTEKVALTLSGARIANILVADSMFVSNGQHEGFVANMLVRIGEGDALFSGCTFRNWPGAAIVQEGTGDAALDFAGCVFDGARSSADYDWSKSNSVLTASASRFSFQGCTFRNIRGPLARFDTGPAELRLTGGMVEDCAENRLMMAADFGGRIGIRDVAGFAPVQAGQGQAVTTLPLWPGAGPWKLTVRLGGSETFAEEAVIHIQDRTAVRVGGWRTASDRQMQFAIANDAGRPVLRAAVRSANPDRARFSAETTG